MRIVTVCGTNHKIDRNLELVNSNSEKKCLNQHCDHKPFQFRLRVRLDMCCALFKSSEHFNEKDYRCDAIPHSIYFILPKSESQRILLTYVFDV